MRTIATKGELNIDELREVANVLKKGGLVIYPTETVYGIGAMCTSRGGVEKLMLYKGARGGKAISVAVGTRKMAMEYVVLNETAEDLYERVLPGPVTVISKIRKGSELVDDLLAPKGTLGIRIPAHILPHQIIEEVGEGITATSANASGHRTPYSVEDILDGISPEQRELIDLVVDHGELPQRETSTVVDTTVDPAKVLRGDKYILNNQAGEWLIQEEKELEKVAGEVLEKVDEQVADDRPLVFLLYGEMGSGKTRFTQALARGLGIEANVISPSFVLERQYEIPKGQGEYLKNYNRLYHYDFWRLDKEEGPVPADKVLEQLGVNESLRSGNILVIEWPDKIPNAVEIFERSANVYELRFSHFGTRRKIWLSR